MIVHLLQNGLSLNGLLNHMNNIIFNTQITHSQRKMFKQYAMIRDFDLYEQDNMEFTNFSAPVFHKDDLMKDTQDNDLETLQVVSKTRSSKTKTPSIQTSFEHTIMEQHFLAFKKTFQKLMENCYPNLKKVQEKSLAHQIFQIDEETATGEQKLKNSIIKDTKFFDQKEKKTFITDLFYEQKLNEFLSKVCGLTHSQLSIELIFIANLFWQSYIPKQQIGLSEAQIDNLIDQLLETENLEKYLEKIEFLNFKQAITPPEISQWEIDQALKVFLKQFGVTVLLVIEEYFNNPFSKDVQGFGGMKRSLNFKNISDDEFSDDQDQIKFSYGHKKRNM